MSNNIQASRSGMEADLAGQDNIETGKNIEDEEFPDEKNEAVSRPAQPSRTELEVGIFPETGQEQKSLPSMTDEVIKSEPKVIPVKEISSGPKPVSIEVIAEQAIKKASQTGDYSELSKRRYSLMQNKQN